MSEFVTPLDELKSKFIEETNALRSGFCTETARFHILKNIDFILDQYLEFIPILQTEA